MMCDEKCKSCDRPGCYYRKENFIWSDTKKTANWITEDEDDLYICSNCREKALLAIDDYMVRDKVRQEKSNFCPNCGRRME